LILLVAEIDCAPDLVQTFTLPECARSADTDKTAKSGLPH